MSIKHGIYIQEEATKLQVPIPSESCVPVIVGTAPVNMAAEPLVNTPVLALSANEAKRKLGYSDDFEHYTLCQSMYLTGDVFPVQPCIYINVLDPAKHNKALAETTLQIVDKQVTIAQEGVILSELKVTATAKELVRGTDYTTDFDETTGYLTLTIADTEATKAAKEVKVSGKVIDPTQVKAADVIGSVDMETGAETGSQVIRQIYPKLGYIPSLLLAPGWTEDPEVGLALIARAQNVNGCFKAMALLDLDGTKAKVYTDIKNVKEDSGYTSPMCAVTWPYAKYGKHIVAGSAQLAAMCQYTDAANGDVPNNPSNHMTSATGCCLRDGTEVVVDQEQANLINSYGVITSINVNGWRLWGNYTGAWPTSTDAKDIWFYVRRIFNWQANNFVVNYFSKVDNPMNRVLIDSIVDSENIRCASYAPDKWAGCTIEYRAADNSSQDILSGKITFRQHVAAYTPAQDIENILDYDVDTLTKVVTGGV